MEGTLTTILVSVISSVLTKCICKCAGVIGKYIRKWLDGDRKD